MILYIYDLDIFGCSLCSGLCVKVWLLVMVVVGVVVYGLFDLVVCDDGSYQWVVYGYLLYVYVVDVNFGQVSGDGVNGCWYIVYFMF